MRIAKETKAIIAIAPEGQDYPGGVLGSPAPGVGRFLYQLSKYRERIIPIGVYEDGPLFCINFGPFIQLDITLPSNPGERDRLVSNYIMEALARLLPEKMRGNYA